MSTNRLAGVGVLARPHLLRIVALSAPAWLLAACGGGDARLSPALQAGTPAPSASAPVTPGQGSGSDTPGDIPGGIDPGGAPVDEGGNGGGGDGSSGGGTPGATPGTTPGSPPLLEASVEATPQPSAAPRVMEKLGRGVVAVPSGSRKVLVTWRLLGLDPADLGFNVYRSAGGAAPVQLNTAPITDRTNFEDATVDLAAGNVYTVKPVVGGVEQAASTSNTLAAHAAVEPVIRIPLAALPAAGYRTKYIWVGDLDGDGEFDFVIDRLAPGSGTPDVGAGHQFLEGYRRDGKRLWQIDMGPLSLYVDNIRPGAATLSMGMLDGATVADLDGDGQAEVILKIADGTVLGDGTVFRESDPELQHLAILDGQTGRLRASTAFPTVHLAKAGRLATQLGVGSSDGLRPTVYLWGRNRNKDKSFNDVFANYSFDGATVTTNWTLARPGSLGAEASHQMRLIDVDGDGSDEFATGNFMVNSNGTWRYVLPGVNHGDRFFIGKFSKDSTGMDGFGVQQNNPSLMTEYYYDATNGTIRWAHHNPAGSGVEDIGRGMAADIDPRFPGFEVWSFKGVHNGPSGVRTEPSDSKPWPAHSLWWDGDLLAENLSGPRMEKWHAATSGLSRVLTLSKFGASLYGENPGFYGDILGDWRTEVVTMNSAQTELIIFTTNVPSGHRLYTMAHNPAYRNHLTIKGYMQSANLDYYLGADMDAPPVPNIRYAGSGRIQAETATLSGGAAVSGDGARFAGTGFVDFPVSDGALTLSRLDGGAGGTRKIRMRFANGDDAARLGVLKVNGVSHGLSFPATGGWSQWRTVSVELPFNAGPVNTLRLESSGQGLARIDEIEVPMP